MPGEVTHFRASDGTELHVERWAPTGEARFVVVVVHGGGEHVSRYDSMARRWAGQGAYVFGPDHRGQGRSKGLPGHVESFTRYAADLHELMLDTVAQQPQLAPDKVPWFVFGHSMGGLISLTYLLEYAADGGRELPLRGAMISAPLLGLTMKVNPVKRIAAKLLDKVAPKLALPTGLPAEHISRDAEEVRIYEADTQRVTVVSARWASAMEAAIERVEQEVMRLRLPMLWYVGTGDLICDPQATRDVFAKLPATEANDQSLRVFDGYFHELHNEPAELRAPVHEMLDTWIRERIDA